MHVISYKKIEFRKFLEKQNFYVYRNVFNRGVDYFGRSDDKGNRAKMVSKPK